MTGHQLWELASIIFTVMFAGSLAVVLAMVVPRALRRGLRRVVRRSRPPVPPKSSSPAVQVSGRPLPGLQERPDILAPHDAVHDRHTPEAAVRFWQLIQANQFDPIDLDDPAEPPPPAPVPSRSRIPAHNRRRRIHARKIARSVYKYVRS